MADEIETPIPRQTGQGFVSKFSKYMLYGAKTEDNYILLYVLHV